jgi:hypothetical protein
MLPKIPYIMEKNKSMTIPVGNLNLSSNFKPGDIADSYGISARRYPQLTNSKDKSLVYSGGRILAMTCFGGEIITVRDTGDGNAAVFAGDTQIRDLSGNHKRTLAAINTKLVVYPDKVYIEKVNGTWSLSNLGAAVVAQAGEATFGTDRVSFTSGLSASTMVGYGAKVAEKTFKGVCNSRATLKGKYLLFYNGLMAPVTERGSGYATCEGYDGEYVTITFKGIPGTISTSDEIFFIIADANGETAFKCKGIISLKYENTYSEFTLIASFEGDMYGFVGKYPCSIYTRDNSYPFDTEKKGRRIKISQGGAEIITGYIKSMSNHEIQLNDIKRTTEDYIFDGPLDIEYLGWDIAFILPEDYIVFGDHPSEFLKVDSKETSGDSFTITFKESASFTLEVENHEEVSATRLMQTGNGYAFRAFKKGDAVTITGSSVLPEGASETVSNDTTFVISEIRDNTIYASAEIFTPGTSTTAVTIERKVPDLDFICEKDNRLYGVNNSEKTIYASALGDPTNMYVYEGLTTDSLVLPVGGEGNFTGCCKYGESVLFFKEDKIYKLAGYTPADFAIDSYDVDGLERGSEKSLVVINEVLYYKGTNGIFAYMGGIPQAISDNFGEDIHLYSNAVAGTDGVNYYIALGNDDDITRMFCYNTRLGLWTQEELSGDTFYGFVRTPSGLHLADDGGNIYRLNASSPAGDCKWMVQFVPLYETIEGKKTYSRLLMRAELPKGSYMIIEVRSDDGPWCEAGKIVGANKGIIPIRLPIARCDKFELRLSGKGEFVLHDILREYHVGSEV